MTARSTLEKIVTPEIRERMEAQIHESIVSLIPSCIVRLKVSEWAEANRVLSPSVTPMPGPFRFSAVPYMREIADCFSETSLVQKVVVMKGAQISFTTAVLENVIGYIIAAAPGPSMFVSADKGVAETSVELRIDAMIESAGLQEKIFAQVTSRHGKKTGDTKARKDFPGGYLMAIGPRVGSKLRSFPVRYLLFDEVDGYPLEVGEKSAKEGDPLVLAEKRTSSFERTRRILYGSTPLIKQSSRIERLFLDGDQRYYFVPCPKCKHMQRLEWKDKDGNYRLKYKQDDDGRLAPGSVVYLCAKCGAPWTNEDKAWFLPRGEWRPTAVAREPGMRSYHLSALYAAVGMRTWENIIQEWVAIGDDTARLRTFINTTLGESFEERGWAPRPERIKARAEGYKVGTLPDTARPLLVTVGADVQDDRIEAEVVAWGRDAESWSLEYLVLWGDTADLHSPAWQGLHTALTSLHAGHVINAVLIDEGGHRTEQARLFCEGFQINAYPVKGESGGARGTGRVFSRREVAGHRVPTIALNVDYMKEVIYGYLAKGTPDGKPPREPFPGFCHFPIDYGDAYYKGLAAEERFLQLGRDGRRAVRWRQVHTRNEPLDCRCYAQGALTVLFDDQRRLLSEEESKEYGWRQFWDQIEIASKQT